MGWMEAFLAAQRLPDDYRHVITAVHVPLAHALAARVRRRERRPVIVGLCGAQGSGKSTLTASLVGLLHGMGVSAVTVSLDDFYLTRARRAELARRVHPLLATRGVPGTHDVPLGLAVFAALAQGRAVDLPSFDKSSDEPRPRAQWRCVQAPVEIVLFEGWCVGAVAQSAPALSAPVNALERDEDPAGIWRRWVNDRLAKHYQEWFAHLEVLLLLRVADFCAVLRGRREQERKLRQQVLAQGGDVSRLMDEAQLLRFISHYERLTRHILAEMPARADQVIDAVRVEAGS